MNEVCREVWEFEHPSGYKVHVIDTEIGIELFRNDVLQILFPDLNEELRKTIIVEANKFYVKQNGEVAEVSTIDAMAVHSLAEKSRGREVRRFMQWVRTNILPYFRKNWEDIVVTHHSRYKFSQIDYSQRESLINYLANQGKDWQDKDIDLYLQFVSKRIPMSTKCPEPNKNSGELLREEYYKLGKGIIEQSESYQELYERLVLMPANLLKAQELDLLVLNLLRKLKRDDSTEIIKQGLFLQALHSVAKNNLVTFGNIEELTPFYLNLMECFSNEILAG